MPFLLHKDDVLSEEAAASDYEKWLNDEAGADGEQGDGEGRSSRKELGSLPQQDNRRFEGCG